MTRALVHIGLAAVVALAPVLCCCKARGLNAASQATPPSTPVSLPLPTESCCFVSITPKKTSCHESALPEPVPAKPTEHKPATPRTPAPCVCCDERPAAAHTESKPQVAAAEPTGELIASAMVSLVAGCPEHFGLFRGLHPPDRVGVDVRFDTLFVRHVLRC
jgi:hypothetical protein